MHRIRLAILLFLCVSAAGCQPVPGVLLDAEAIVMEHPDSAARLLEGVPAPEKRLSRRNYAHYALVLTQARWLAGENMIDDTLSDVALDYYRTHTDDFAAAHKAYYYAAKIANQRRQPEVAMTLLLKSRDMLPPKGALRRVDLARRILRPAASLRGEDTSCAAGVRLRGQHGALRLDVHIARRHGARLYGAGQL